MDNISINNAALKPALKQGWVFNRETEPPVLDRAGSSQRIEINSITAMILNYCDGSHSVAQIIDILCAQYPDAVEAIAGDVEDVLRQLQQQGALRFTPSQVQQVFEIPEKTPASETRKELCIGMATYDDYDGVYFSVQAIRLYHPEILDKLEIIVIDNHPDGPCGQALKNLESWIPGYRYIPTEDIRGTAVRDVIFREANSDYVMCIDSHVMIEPGAISKLLEYFESAPDTKDLLQGPLLSDDLVNISTHFIPEWREGMYGTWGYDERGAAPDGSVFDIPMQGLGLFACRKSVWTGFNPRFSGFGGEEGYLHEKFRQAGGRTLCLPFLRWIHRFVRPMGTRYEVKWGDRIRNYMIGFSELGLPTDELVTHFQKHIGERKTNTILETVRAELADPAFYFDALYCVYDAGDIRQLQSAQNRLRNYSALQRMEYIDSQAFSEHEPAATVMAYQYIVNKARVGGYQNILVLNAATLRNFPSLNELQILLAKTEKMDWQAVILEGAGEPKILQAGQVFPEGCQVDKIGAVLYRHDLYDGLLENLSNKLDLLSGQKTGSG